jgi:hypothetical protein
MNSKYDIDYLRAFTDVLAAGNPNTKSMHQIVERYYSALDQAPKKKEYNNV